MAVNFTLLVNLLLLIGGACSQFDTFDFTLLVNLDFTLLVNLILLIGGACSQFDTFDFTLLVNLDFTLLRNLILLIELKHDYSELSI